MAGGGIKTFDDRHDVDKAHTFCSAVSQHDLPKHIVDETAGVFQRQSAFWKAAHIITRSLRRNDEPAFLLRSFLLEAITCN